MKQPAPSRRPLFLHPDRYRRRRLMDAARMLPILGGFLFLLPVLWRPDTEGHSTAIDGIYLFGVWALLILCAAAFAPGLAVGDAPGGQAGPAGGHLPDPGMPAEQPGEPPAEDINPKDHRNGTGDAA